MRKKYPKHEKFVYNIWQHMIDRCTNPQNPRYKDYGGRGITVSEEWKDFNNFLADMGEKLKDGELDRINNDEGYELENCKVSTRKEQANNRRSNHMLTAWGETKTMMQWSEDPRCPVNYDCLKIRINVYDWNAEEAISTPKGKTCTIFNETKTHTEWSRDIRCVVPYKTFAARLSRGWDAEKALTKPC